MQVVADGHEMALIGPMPAGAFSVVQLPPPLVVDNDFTGLHCDAVARARTGDSSETARRRGVGLVDLPRACWSCSGSR